MKKTYYFIAVRRNGSRNPYGIDIEHVPGYVFIAGGRMFGVTNKYRDPEGKVQATNAWTVTDLASGHTVGITGLKRRDAVSKLKAVVTQLIPAIEKASQDERIAYCIGRIKWMSETLVPASERPEALLA